MMKHSTVSAWTVVAVAAACLLAAKAPAKEILRETFDGMSPAWMGNPATTVHEAIPGGDNPGWNAQLGKTSKTSGIEKAPDGGARLAQHDPPGDGWSRFFVTLPEPIDPQATDRITIEYRISTTKAQKPAQDWQGMILVAVGGDKIADHTKNYSIALDTNPQRDILKWFAWGKSAFNAPAVPGIAPEDAGKVFHVQANFVKDPQKQTITVEYSIAREGEDAPLAAGRHETKAKAPEVMFDRAAVVFFPAADAWVDDIVVSTGSGFTMK